MTKLTYNKTAHFLLWCARKITGAFAICYRAYFIAWKEAPFVGFLNSLILALPFLIVMTEAKEHQMLWLEIFLGAVYVGHVLYGIFRAIFGAYEREQEALVTRLKE